MKYEVSLPKDARMPRTVGDVRLKPGDTVTYDELPLAVTMLVKALPGVLVITEIGKKAKSDKPSTPGKTEKQPPSEVKS